MIARKKNKCAAGSRKALSLIEVLIAVGVFGIAVGGLLLLFSYCIILNETNRNLTSAVSHAEFALEDVKHTASLNIVSIPGTYNGVTWNAAGIAALGVAPLSSEAILFSVAGAGPYTVSVTVQWRERSNRLRSVSLNTYIVQ